MSEEKRQFIRFKAPMKLKLFFPGGETVEFWPFGTLVHGWG